MASGSLRAAATALGASRAAQLAAAAVAGGLAALAAAWLAAVAHRRRELRRLKVELSAELAFDAVGGRPPIAPKSDRNSKTPAGPDAGGPAVLDDEEQELVHEQLVRNVAFLGEDGVARCRKAFVIIIGLGGVGSHAAHMLLRSGVEHLRLIDFDQVTLSSLNRHAVARRADVGTFKVTAMQQHLKEIMPHAHIEAVSDLFKRDNAETLLAGNPDFVLDCIDNISTKVDLLEYCSVNGIRVVSSMGAGAKSDPSRIQIADISDTFEDPLARVTRRSLRLRGVESGITVVYSTEKPGSIKLLDLDPSQMDDPTEFAPLPNFRSRILPVLGTLPALFGTAMASYVVTELAGFETEPIPIKLRRKATERMYSDLRKHAYVHKYDVKVNADDVGFITDETWGSRSAVSGIASDGLVLLRWDKTRPAELGNLICLTRAEAHKHDLLTLDDYDRVYGSATVERVQKRFAVEMRLRAWRTE